ncbi:PstS family phosphate ABC transporter substrate-binding protein [Pontibacillus sp. HMF3514]|uniref:PstS family phosphate ABC transporter substrate-binding protein n=1 Tax=Pontibacillus sp. HMF3514 TaxID=2692425 RepID=UPI0013201E89|nr:PstS family phosphate ABC transporter substrate-binding protein [Pontibacillus sp. HMF3514]QHE52974.1 phosphate ABC transporter substrate-binding protein PstS family protein [Pontibacillus sp. HMF3514]
MKSFKNLALLFTLTLVLGALAACGNAPNEGNNAEGGNGEGNLSGSVAIDGSSTVHPIMEVITYNYREEAPNVETSLGVSGSGGGFKKFTRGDTDLSNASRPIKEEEKKIAKENGIEYKELKVAYDGLSVVVSKKNDFLKNITVKQLQEIFLAEAGNKKWSDVNPEWPDKPIKIYSPGHDSGTFDYFNEAILKEKEMVSNKNVTLHEDDNVLVKGIKNDPYAIGYFGYAYYLENKDSLKVLGIDNGDGNPVKPNGETIQDGSYDPLSRPLYTYVSKESLKNKPQVVDFTTFALKNAGSAAEDVGYVALPEEKYKKQIEEVKEIAGK